MYAGATAQIPLGISGIRTDDAPNQLPLGALIRAKNVIIENGVVQRDYGSRKWNKVALDAGIVAMYDWWPNPGRQYRIVVTRDGKIYRFSDPYTKTEITPTGSAPANLKITERVHIVEGGAEDVGNPKKLFIFSGNDPIQVISGENATRSNISKPAVDWNGFYPFFGIIFFGRLMVFGNANRPHFIYGSSDSDHEDFSSVFNLFLNNIFPSDGVRLQHGFIYKGRLHVVKYPRGLYGLNVQDIGDTSSWYFSKLHDDFGTASIAGGCGVMDDYWVTTADANIVSLGATFSLGQVEQANVLKNLKVENYIKQITAPHGVGERQAFWFPTRKLALFLYRSVSATKNGLIIKFDFIDVNPKVTIVDKQFVNAITTFRNVSQEEVLAFGGEDGFIYEETEDRVIGELQDYDGDDLKITFGDVFESEIQTPNMDFQSPKDKNFEFLELEYIPTGAFNLQCDVFIDGNYTQTKSFYVGRGNQLDVSKLDQMRLQARAIRTHRLPIRGRGKSISCRLYTSGENENCKLVMLNVGFRQQGENEKGAASSDK